MGFYSSLLAFVCERINRVFRYRNAQHQTDADGQRNGYLKGADAVGKGQRIVALYKIVGGVVDARTGHQREDAGQQEHRYRHFNHNGKHAGEQGERNDRQQGGCGTVCPQHHGQLVDKPAHGTHQPAEEQAFARTAEQNGKTQGACAGNKELRGQLPNLCTGQHHATTTPVKNV